MMKDVLFCEGSGTFSSLTSWFFYEHDGYSWMIEISNRGDGLWDSMSMFGNSFRSSVRIVRWKKGRDVEAFANKQIEKAPPPFKYAPPGHTSQRTLEHRKMQVGFFYPRIWRPGSEGIPMAYDNPADFSTQPEGALAAQSLCKRLIEIFGTVQPTTPNLSVFGHRIREVLLLAAMEVESAWAGVLKANGFLKDRMTTADYVKLRDPMRLDSYTVHSVLHLELGLFDPFKGWDETCPTKSLPWYAAYNSTKHSREENFQEATLKNAILAVAAALVMHHAQFGPSGLGATQAGNLYVSSNVVGADDFYVPLVDPALTADGNLKYHPRTKPFSPIPYPF